MPLGMVPRRLRPNSRRVRTRPGALREAGWRTTGFSANGNGGSLANLDEGFPSLRRPEQYLQTQGDAQALQKYGKTVPAEKHDEAIREDCIRYVGLPTGELSRTEPLNT